MKHIDMEKIKQYLLKKDHLVILILTGILLVVIAWPVGESSVKKNKEYDLWYSKSGNMGNEQTETDDNIDSESMEERESVTGIIREEYIVSQLEQRLENILSSMQGAGRVKVMITLASSGEKIVEKDIPLERSNLVENDSSGGNRSTNEMYSQEETVYSTNAQGDKIPYVIRENSAVVEGVSVVCEGGDNSLIQKDISEVIQALFGIEAHKIKVVKMKQIE